MSHKEQSQLYVGRCSGIFGMPRFPLSAKAWEVEMVDEKPHTTGRMVELRLSEGALEELRELQEELNQA